MVLTRLPLTITGKRCPPGCCAWTASSPQLQNVMPVAAAVPLRKSLRVAIPISSLVRSGLYS